MKKVLAVFLAFTLVFGLVSVPVGAKDIKFEIKGIKYGNSVSFIVCGENLGEMKDDFKVYVAEYEDKALKSAKIHTEEIGVGESAVFSYKAEGKAEIFIWEDGLKPAVPSFTSAECETVDLGAEIKIPYTSRDAFASYTPEETNPAGNACDGDINTKWTVSGSSKENKEHLTIYLGEEYVLSKIGIAFGAGIEREHIYSVQASSDGENFVTLVPEAVSKKTNELQFSPLAPISAKYIRVNVMGRTDNGQWVQISEVEAYGYRATVGAVLMENVNNWQISPMTEMTYTDYTPVLGEELYADESDGLYLYDNVDRNNDNTGEKLTVNTVTASQTPENANHHNNVLDGSLSTIWTASSVTDEKPAYLTADLGKGYYLTRVGIGFDKGNERTYSFDVAVSEDGVNYKKVIQKRTSDKTNDVQYFDFDATYARYVKYTFYKRTDANDNGWVRISEAEVYGGENPVQGAGGILAQKRLELPPERGNYAVEFEVALSGNVYYSGVSLAQNFVTGGADLSVPTALQLRFDNDGDKFKIKYIKSNYFNEGNLIDLFDSSFAKDRAVTMKLDISPMERKVSVTADDGDVRETKIVYFSHGDEELTRNTRWSGWEANTLIFNTGAGAKGNVRVKNLTLKDTGYVNSLSGAEPCYGVVRLEAVRRENDPTSSGDYYGRYVYYRGKDEVLSVAADKNPEVTRFVEHRGLLGCGVSLEAENLPGYYIVNEGDAFYLKKMEHSGSFYARATFIKDEAENVGYYGGKTYSYRTYLQKDNEDKFLYDTTSDKKTGDLKPWKMWDVAQGTFYIKNEGVEYVADNFYGTSIGGQWWTNYPWKGNNPTNDSYNHSGLITKNNVIVENGELLLKATKINLSSWVKDKSGETGISYNKWGKTWEQWKGYVGVVSIQNKVYNRNCFVEGSFKQPESPIGYWNALWLTGRDSWPPEIDIFETLSSSYGSKAWHTAIHGEGDKNNLFGKSSKDNIDITTGYHTFSMDWGYDYIKFYIDGKLYQRTHNNATLNFQKNMRLILNTGIGGWEAEPDGNMVWNDGLRCKYIRTFQY